MIFHVEHSATYTRGMFDLTTRELIAKILFITTEYHGKRRASVAVCGVSFLVSGEHIAVYLMHYGLCASPSRNETSYAATLVCVSLTHTDVDRIRDHRMNAIYLFLNCIIYALLGLHTVFEFRV